MLSYSKIRGLISEEMSDMEDQEIFPALFGLKKYGIIDENRLQLVGRGDNESFKKSVKEFQTQFAICCVERKKVDLPPLGRKSILKSSPHADKKRRIALMYSDVSLLGVIKDIHTSH